MLHATSCALTGQDHESAIENLVTSMCLQAIRKPRPPPVLKDHYDEADYKKTQAYNVDKWCGPAAGGRYTALCVGSAWYHSHGSQWERLPQVAEGLVLLVHMVSVQNWLWPKLGFTHQAGGLNCG